MRYAERSRWQRAASRRVTQFCRRALALRDYARRSNAQERNLHPSAIKMERVNERMIADFQSRARLVESSPRVSVCSSRKVGAHQNFEIQLYQAYALHSFPIIRCIKKHETKWLHSRNLSTCQINIPFLRSNVIAKIALLVTCMTSTILTPRLFDLLSNLGDNLKRHIFERITIRIFYAFHIYGHLIKRVC